MRWCGILFVHYWKRFSDEQMQQRCRARQYGKLVDLQYKSVINFPPSKVMETSRKGIEVLEMVCLNWMFLCCLLQ